MSSENQHNTKKAVAFLKALFPGKRVNIVAIDPKSENVSAITRPVDSDDVVNFIYKNNGKRNLYYSVNTPTDNAPDNKLKKHHIKEINAVWLDADPFKDKDFKEERDRLHKFAKELASSENPPTVITDSGGGIQAFWMLEKPVPVNDDTRSEYEALSRGLAEQYGTDKVQNIDRIMRVPYTFNLPTAKKKGREVILARASRISDRRYKEFPFITPSEANDTKDDYSDIKLDMEVIKKPIQNDIAAKLKLALDRNNRLHDIYFGLVDKPSRSEQDFILAGQLKHEGFTLEETANILWNFTHGKRNDLTKREIIRCYMRSDDNSIESDFVSSISQEDINRITAQVNPLKTVKEAARQAASRNSALITGDKVDYRKNSIPLVKGLIDRNTTNLFFGPSTGGKSFLIIDMVVALAQGYEFWDQYRIPEKCGVLVVNGEGGGGYHKRVEVAMRKHKIVDRSPKNFPFGFITGTFNLFNDDEFSKRSRQYIIDCVKELEEQSGHKVRLVIYDTMSKMLGSGNENDAKDVRVFQGNVERIAAQCDLASLIVHHIGKDESAGPRGSYALLGDMDAQLQLTVKKTGNGRTHYLSSPKQKDHADDKVTAFKLNVMELGKDDDGDSIDSCFVVLKNDQNAALFPSVEDELDSNAKSALKAIRYYHSIPAIENSGIRHTEKQIKTILFKDFKENNKVFDENDATNALLQLSAMAKPDKSVLRAFERCCDTLATKGLTRKDAKSQLVDQDRDTCDRDAT